jgi:hypothetical protein
MGGMFTTGSINVTRSAAVGSIDVLGGLNSAYFVPERLA